MLRAFGAWLRPVERTVRVREVPSSNLGAPTVNLPARLQASREVFIANLTRAGSTNQT